MGAFSMCNWFLSITSGGANEARERGDGRSRCRSDRRKFGDHISMLVSFLLMSSLLGSLVNILTFHGVEAATGKC